MRSFRRDKKKPMPVVIQFVVHTLAGFIGALVGLFVIERFNIGPETSLGEGLSLAAAIGVSLAFFSYLRIRRERRDDSAAPVAKSPAS